MDQVRDQLKEIAKKSGKSLVIKVGDEEKPDKDGSDEGWGDDEDVNSKAVGHRVVNNLPPPPTLNV